MTDREFRAGASAQLALAVIASFPFRANSNGLAVVDTVARPQTFIYSLIYDRNNNDTHAGCGWLLLDLSPRRRRPFRSHRHLFHSKNVP